MVILGALLHGESAQAHARYLRSEPGAGALVASAPRRVDIWFTQELFRRQGENWIRVFGAQEQPVHAGEAVIDDDDRTHMWVELEAGLPLGTYRVEWRTLSAEDGDTDEGEFRFSYDPQATVTSTPMVREETATAEEQPTPTSPPSPSPFPAVQPTPTLPAAATVTPAPAGGGPCPLGLMPLGLAALALLSLRRVRRR